ncbi:MAG: serine hydrolase domain-containing protein [Tissierellia bacterium]|nr:serine hydrolase domain-containing protein [Tissierellia bacterium]
MDKLKNLDEKFLNDHLIYDACIYLFDASNNRSHLITKGNVKNKKFYLSSLTSLFTHSIIFQLIDEKYLSYTDKISKYLKACDYKAILKIKGIDYSGQITIKDLLDQTSGLCNYEKDFLINDRHIFDILAEKDLNMCYESALDACKTLRPIHKPRTKQAFYYSPLNIVLLGKIAEIVSKKAFSQLLKERIFLKINLDNTSIIKSDIDLIPIHFKNASNSPIKYFSSNLAYCGLGSNQEDMMTFIIAFFSGALFNKDHIEKVDFNFPKMSYFGYGSGLMKLKVNKLRQVIDGMSIVGYMGNTGAFAFNLQGKDIFVVGSLNQTKINPNKYVYSYLKAFLKGS